MVIEVVLLMSENCFFGGGLGWTASSLGKGGCAEGIRVSARLSLGTTFA